MTVLRKIEYNIIIVDLNIFYNNCYINYSRFNYIIGERDPALGHFSFSNFFKLLAEI